MMRKQSGQATVEMAIMLIGFMILIVGLIFTMGMVTGNTKTLLSAKYNAEYTANGGNAATLAGAGQEISSWDYDRIFGAEIPFTRKDSPNIRIGGFMTYAQHQMDAAEYSRPLNTSYSYNWVSLPDFSQAEFKHDFRTRHDDLVSAAQLVMREGDDDKIPIVSGVPELYRKVSAILGVRITPDSLKDNPTNRVYMPANGEL